MDNGTKGNDSVPGRNKLGVPGSNKGASKTIDCAVLRREVKKRIDEASYTQVTLARKAGVSASNGVEPAAWGRYYERSREETR